MGQHPQKGGWLKHRRSINARRFFVGKINLTRDEMAAIKAIDDELVRKLMDKCLQEQRIYPLRTLQLERCGEFVASRLGEYERTLSDLGKARSPKKVDRMEQLARRARGNLDSAIYQVMHRAKAEEDERQRFFVDDLIMSPTRFDEHLSVRISYRWRKTADDDWAHGSITFTHEVDTRPDYSVPQPKRKPSAAKLQQERQGKLWREWEYLKMLALGSVKEFLQGGGNGADIPKSFKAVADSHSRGLNNHSADFWR